MSANIFGERFYSHREPAWHNLGLVLEEELSAQEAFRRMGAYDVKLVGMRTTSGLKVPGKAIVRIVQKAAVGGGVILPEHIYGTVSDTYTLIRPEQACAIYDGAIGKPVETIGALGAGEILFISTHLPSFDVRGDEVANYLLVVSPVIGGQAAEIRITPVRVVCQNTLEAARATTTALYKVIHDQHATERFGSWMHMVYERLETRVAALREAFDILAGHQITVEEETRVLAATYPQPKRPRENAPEEVMARRLENWQGWVEKNQERQGAVRELFAGSGVGMEHPAAAGTSWGLYNAVAEFENFRRGRGDESIAQDVLFGNRGDIMSAAFEAALEISRN